MRFYLILETILMLVIIGSIVGCSDAGEITSPDSALTQPNVSQAVNQSDSHCLWGLWEVIADPEAGTLDFTELRTAAMHMNVVPILEPPAGVKLKVSNLKFNAGICDVDVTLIHPFAGMSQYIGFDVAGIMMSKGTYSGFNDSGLVMPAPGETRLLNPDGYTRWWNPVEFAVAGPPIFRYRDGLLGNKNSVVHFTSTLNGYKLFCEGLNSTDAVLDVLDPTSRAPFLDGASHTRHYTIDFSGGVVFNYAVDANWRLPVGTPPFSPDDYAPEANRPEAWAVSIEEISNTLWNDGIGKGGDLILQIEVWDHFDAELNTIILESPGNFDPATSNTIVDSGDGFCTFEVNVVNATPKSGSIDILVQVISDVTGYAGVLTDKPVTAYFTHQSIVSDSNAFPPKALMHATTPTDIQVGQAVSFDATASKGAPPLLFEWDFNGDGVYNGTGDEYTGGHVTPTHTFGEYGSFNVTVKVTNSYGFDISDAVVVNTGVVLPKALMHATTPTTINYGESVSFNATASTGSPPLTFEWDFNGDGTFAGVNDNYSGDVKTPTHVFNQIGNVNVRLKVSNAGGYDISAPVTVTIGYDSLDIFVDADYTGSDSNGTPQKPYRTIQEGMIAVTSGKTVHVDYYDGGSNTYDTTDLTLKSNVKLIGDNWNGGGPGKPKADITTNTTTFAGSSLSNFTLEGFEIGLGEQTGNPSHYGISFNYGSNITIRHNKITDEVDDTGLIYGTTMPIRVSSANNVKIEYNDIGPITWYSTTGGEYARVLWGIYADKCSNSEIKCNFVHDFTIDYHGGNSFEQIRMFCIHAYTCEGIKIHNNLICHIKGLNNYSYRMQPFIAEGPYSTLSSFQFYNNTVDSIDNSTADQLYNSMIGLCFYSSSGYPFTNTWIKNELITNLTQNPGNTAHAYISSGDNTYNITYSTAYNITVNTQYFQGLNVGAGCVNYPGVNPKYVNNTTKPYDYHFQSGSGCEMGDPTFIDWDDTGSPSGNPNEPNIQNRSRMGCFGGPDGNWDPYNL